MKKKKINFYYGLGDNTSNYKALSKLANIIKINWNHPEKVKSPKCEIAVGFSMGCYLAMDYAEKNQVKKLILCSLPPTEDLGKLKAKKIFLMYGSKEKFSIKNAPRGHIVMVVRGAGHNITGNYLNILIRLLNEPAGLEIPKFLIKA